MSIRGPKNQTSKADRTPKKTSDLATDGHGYTRMRSAGFLALDREKIGTKLYGYVLAKRYTTVVPRFSKFPTAVWGLAAFCLARSRRDGRRIRLNGCLTASMPQGPRLFFRTRTRHGCPNFWSWPRRSASWRVSWRSLLARASCFVRYNPWSSYGESVLEELGVRIACSPRFEAARKLNSRAWVFTLRTVRRRARRICFMRRAG